LHRRRRAGAARRLSGAPLDGGVPLDGGAPLGAKSLDLRGGTRAWVVIAS
jgi:hypothetical protein